MQWVKSLNKRRNNSDTNKSQYTLCSHINVDFLIKSNGLSLLRKNKHWIHCVPIISMLITLKGNV